MYYKKTQANQLLKVEDGFATLKSVDDKGDLTFEFEYAISQTDAIKNKTLSVNITAYTQKIQKTKILESVTNQPNTKQTIENILLHIPLTNSAIKNHKEFTIGSVKSDITAFIDNELVGKIRKATTSNSNEVFSSSRTLKTISSFELKQSNNNFPVLHFETNQSITSSINDDVEHLAHKMIINHGIDPSYIVDLTNRNTTAIESMEGILRPTQTRFEYPTHPASRLLNYYLFGDTRHPVELVTSDIPDNKTQQVIVNESQDELKIYVKFIIPKHKIKTSILDLTNCFIKFDLMQNNAPFNTIIKNINLYEHINSFFIPKIPPIVSQAPSVLGNQTNLSISQVDQNANGVSIYKKNINRMNILSNEYVKIGDYKIEKLQNNKIISVESSQHLTTLYRVIPTHDDIIGYSYTNIVVNPKKITKSKAIVLSSKLVSNGILLSALDMSSEIISIQFLSRNLTTHETNFHSISEPILVDSLIKESKSMFVLDKDVQEHHVYEYILRIFYLSGTSDYAGNVVTEFIHINPGKVDTKISNIIIDHDNSQPNVSFSIDTTIIDNNIDIISFLLKQQNVYDSFQNDITKEREFIKGLITHNVQRVDLTTGTRSDYGIISNTQFSDVALQVNNSCEPLIYGHKYRYDVFVSIRLPETMLQKFFKKMIDPVTKKVYFFHPEKFLHPLALREGILVTPMGLKSLYSQNEWGHGIVGLTQTVDISLDIEQIKIVKAEAKKLNNYTNIISWSTQGNISNVDHFLIIKESHSIRTIIGRAHANLANGNFIFQHVLSRYDTGEFSYKIIPVNNSFKDEQSISTNSVII